jgi:hypothetical protein
VGAVSDCQWAKLDVRDRQKFLYMLSSLYNAAARREVFFREEVRDHGHCQTSSACDVMIYWPVLL